MRRMGVVLTPYGVPRAGLAVTIRNWATGAVVTTTTTNANGRWEANLADETIQYWVEVDGGAPSLQKTVQTPASIELEYLFVRYGSKAAPGAAIDYSGAASVSLPAGATIGGSPGMSQATADTRYVNIDGDTMTGPLTVQAKIQARAANPVLSFYDTDAAVGEKAWQLNLDARVLQLRLLDDAEGSASGDNVRFTRGTGQAMATFALRGGGTDFVVFDWPTRMTTVEGFQANSALVLGGVTSRTNQPSYAFYDTDEADVDGRWWEWQLDAKILVLRLRNNAGGAGGDGISFHRGTGLAMSQMRLNGGGVAFATFDWAGNRAVNLAVGQLVIAPASGVQATFALETQGAAAPLFNIKRNGNAADNRVVDFNVDTSGSLNFRAINDLYNNSGTWLALTRSGVSVTGVTAFAPFKVQIATQSTPALALVNSDGTFRAGLHYNGALGGLAVSAAAFSGTTNNAYGSAPVTGNRKIAVFNESGTIVGYLPVYV